MQRSCITGRKGASVHCPFCRHPDSRVVDSREADDGTAIRRRRSCPECGRRFTTVETAGLSVLKRSGATEPFSRRKVIDGVRKACSGRPVDEDALALLAQQVEEAVRSTGAAEVPAHDVGLAILGPLRDLDEVAYMRFASVYRGFDSLDDFSAAIAELRAYQELTSSAPAYGGSSGPAYGGSSGTAYDDVTSVARYGGAHDPAPPPVHVPSAG
jgi:transcriptional repressor NrdR